MIVCANDRIDLLFTDLVMPGVDGVELARRAGQEVPGLKVLFTTGYSTDPTPEGRLLKKPYRPRQLAGAIAAALARYRTTGYPSLPSLRIQ